MTVLFRRDDGAIPLADLASIQWSQPPLQRGRYIAKRNSGGSVTLEPWEYRELMTRPVQLCPAEPGTKLVIPFVSENAEDDVADTVPILNWALCVDGKVRPVLPTGVRRGHDIDIHLRHWTPDYIQAPDGSIYAEGYEADHDRYDTVDAVLAHERQRWLEHVEEEAARAAAAGEKVA